MDKIQPGKRVVLAAVVPAHGDEYAPLIEAVVAEIERAGGKIVGRVIQRHGVSRGKNRGGASAMKRAAPLNLRTVLGTGKADELAKRVRETRAEVVVFCNPLTPTQKRALEELVGVEVLPLPKVARGVKNNTGVSVPSLAKPKQTAQADSVSAYQQYTNWLPELKNTFDQYLQGATFYAAEYSFSCTVSLASSIPLFSAYSVIDSLNQGLIDALNTGLGFPKSDIKDEKALNRKMEELRLRLIEIIYGMEKEGGIDNEHRYYKE